MPIIKSKHAGDYTVLPNEIMRSGMSLEAIGLLAVLLMNKHEWVIYKTTLHATLKIGREKLDRIFKELQENGYILSVQKISKETGKFEYEHIVYDKPYNGEVKSTDPITAEPFTGLPHTVNQPLINTNNNKEEYSNKKEIDKEKDAVKDNSKVIERVKDFYKTEIDKSVLGGAALVGQYKMFANYLFAANPTGEPVEHVLRIPRQVTYDNFVDVFKLAGGNMDTIFEKLNILINTEKYAKGKKFLHLIIMNYIAKDARK